MKAENLILDNSCQRQIVEELCELFPDISVAIFSQTLIIEAIPLRKSELDYF